MSIESVRPVDIIQPPEDLRRFLILARKTGYAGGAEPKIVGSERMLQLNLSKYYEDHWFTYDDPSALFIGQEDVYPTSRNRGKPQFSYAYMGALTGHGIEFGPEEIYTKLRHFLFYHVEQVRFGYPVTIEFFEGKGRNKINWSYRSEPEPKSFGWIDEEYILRNGEKVYEFAGTAGFPHSSLPQR